MTQTKTIFARRRGVSDETLEGSRGRRREAGAGASSSSEPRPSAPRTGGLWGGTRVAARALAGVVGSMVFLSATAGFAQAPGAGGPSPLSLVVLLAALSLLPFLLIMVTSFVKVAVVLSILRTAIGTQQVPPNQVITGLAIILSLYIMAPVGMEMYEEIAPQIEAYEQQRDTEEGPKFGLTEAREIGAKVAAPLRGFLLKHADEEERLLLYELALELRTPEQRESVAPDDLMVAVPAFVITELKEAFIIGFLLFVPFIVVDLVVANILLSLGMHMLSPTTVSLPFKLLLFVLVDGWYLVVRGLILGYV